ncbi:NlpC/P60 family protein [Streptomyces sp. NPDC059853]|uniref:C40 family peptidase n=1 Tax=Streptomyces sp. NPDC059853 TaxID=3346973 RepID=UPI003659861E
MTTRTRRLPALLLAVLTLAAAPAARAEPVDAGPPGTAALLAELHTLYERAGAATDAYNATEERLTAQRDRVAELSRRLADTRTELAATRDAIGALAREQYRGGGLILPASLRLLLGADPDRELTGAAALERAAESAAAALERLETGERHEGELAGEARAALDAQQELAEERERQRDAVTERLEEVETLLAGLSEPELAELAALERTGTARAQEQLLARGALGEELSRAPSAEGERALAYAIEQLGKPYAWGAEGPDSFDCSGLTMQAWALGAGRPIPRTSQQQWERLERVPLDALRPGDLVVYFEDATHVGLYAGDGMVIHAPRPGATVKVSPLAANPPLGAVRPDPEAEPLPSWTPPDLPDWASEGEDSGYDHP